MHLQSLLCTFSKIDFGLKESKSGLYDLFLFGWLLLKEIIYPFLCKKIKNKKNMTIGNGQYVVQLLALDSGYERKINRNRDKKM